MRKGWIRIKEFREWEEGRGVIYAALNFQEAFNDYKIMHKLSVNVTNSLSNIEFGEYIMRKLPPDIESGKVLEFLGQYCVRVYSELSSLSKLSSFEWLCIGIASEFLLAMPSYNRNFNTFYQTYSVIVSCVEASNLRALGMRQIDLIIDELSKLPIYSGVTFDAEIKDKIIQASEKTLNYIKAMRTLEFTSFDNVSSLAPDSFSSFYFTMQYMFQKIVLGEDCRGVLYRRTLLKDPEHLQNSLVKAWRIIHNNKVLHAEAHSLFMDISRQGHGPVAADVVRTPIGSILAYAIVQRLELQEEHILIPTGIADKNSYLQDLYFRLSIRLDRYNMLEEQLEEILDEELNINNKIVTKDLLAYLKSILDCHHSVRRYMFSREEQSSVRALIVGDSVAAGYGVNEEVTLGDSTSAGGVYTYPRRSAAMTTHHAVDSVVIANASLVGSVTSDGVGSIGAMLDVHNPDIVVLTQGGNDTILAGLGGNASSGAHVDMLLSNIKRNFERMIKECLERNPDIVIILSLKIPEGGLFILHKAVNASLLSKVFQPLSDKYPNVQITKLPEEPFADTADMRLPDKIHLTEAANAILARHMIATIGTVGERMLIAKSSRREVPKSSRDIYEERCSQAISDLESETTRVICGASDVNMHFVMDEIRHGVATVVAEESIDPYGAAMLGALRNGSVKRRCRL